MNIVKKLKGMLIGSHPDVVNLVCDLLGKVKIVELTEEEVARLVEIIKPKAGA